MSKTRQRRNTMEATNDWYEGIEKEISSLKEKMAKGDYSAYPALMLVLFLLLEALTFIRMIQEFRENGVWLEQG